jgi:hypothetical protein
MKKHEYAYLVVLYSSYILYFLILVGFQLFDLSEYIILLDFCIKVYVCLILIMRFNPFRTLETFSEFDRQLVFTAAIFLLANIGFVSIFRNNIDLF